MTEPAPRPTYSADTSTGLVPEAFVARLTEAFSALPGLDETIQAAARGTLLTVWTAADIAHAEPSRINTALDAGAIPFTPTPAGRHRLIRYSDLLAWMREDKAGRLAAVDEITALTEGLFDDDGGRGDG